MKKSVYLNTELTKTGFRTNDYLDRHEKSRRRATTDRNVIRDDLVKDLEEAGLKRPGTNSFHKRVAF